MQLQGLRGRNARDSLKFKVDERFQWIALYDILNLVCTFYRKTAEKKMDHPQLFLDPPEKFIPPSGAKVFGVVI
jgi:hypothetical protein